LRPVGEEEEEEEEEEEGLVGIGKGAATERAEPKKRQSWQTV
jgi:hypothetical protein